MSEEDSDILLMKMILMRKERYSNLNRLQNVIAGLTLYHSCNQVVCWIQDVLVMVKISEDFTCDGAGLTLSYSSLWYCHDDVRWTMMKNSLVSSDMDFKCVWWFEIFDRIN